MSLFTGSFADKVLDIAIQASAILMEHYEGDIEVSRKSDHSPVTTADIAANEFIVKELRKLTTAIPVISEEGEKHVLPKENKKMFWLVDPLDGTKSFISRSGEFTVNIALIQQGVPIFGVVTLPTKKILYYTDSNRQAFKHVLGGSRTPIRARHSPADGVVVVASKSHRTPETDSYIQTLNTKSLVSAASSLKFCLVAEGQADIYPRFGTTMEWDTAAGHAIVLAAGGSVETLDGKPLVYGKEGFVNPHFIVKGL